MKKLISNKPWRAWATRKVVLMSVILFWVLYVVAMILLATLLGVEVSQLDTLTEQVFSAGKWLVVSGCAITIAKVAKGKTNSDKTEIFPDGGLEDSSDEEAEG